MRSPGSSTSLSLFTGEEPHLPEHEVLSMQWPNDRKEWAVPVRMESFARPMSAL